MLTDRNISSAERSSETVTRVSSAENLVPDSRRILRDQVVQVLARVIVPDALDLAVRDASQQRASPAVHYLDDLCFCSEK